jgi:hypothetical protein
MRARRPSQRVVFAARDRHKQEDYVVAALVAAAGFVLTDRGRPRKIP